MSSWMNKLTLERLEDRQLLSAGITELPLPSGVGKPVDRGILCFGR
jgi:hypothetical protein